MMSTEKAKPSRHDRPQWIRAGILLGNTFNYRQQNCARHNALNLSILCLIFLSMGWVGYLSTVLPPLIFIPLGALALGYGYFMLFILIVHEASHNMFIILKNRQRSRRWNRFFGWLVCVPFGIDYVQHWEVGHRIHHLNPCTTIDPQNCPSTLYTGAKLFRFILKTIAIPGFIQFSAAGYHCPVTESYGFNGRLLAGQCLGWIAFALLSVVAGNWPLLLAAFLGLQIVAVLNLFKIAMEHGGDISQAENPYLRSVSSLFPLRSLIMPFNISLHFEHHLNACVPWYELMTYHHQLQAIMPEEMRSHLINTDREVWARIQAPMPQTHLSP